jgi:PIN like domain
LKRRSRTSEPPEPTFFVDRDLAGKRFLEILRAASIQVVDHNDHFDPTTPDGEWLAFVGSRGLVAVTRDKLGLHSLETRQLMEAGARVFVLVGSAPHPELADNFVATMPRILRFLKRNRGPFIAKVSRPNERDRQLGRSGQVGLWLSHADWKKPRAERPLRGGRCVAGR